EVEFAEVFDPQDSEETVGGRLNLGIEASRKGQGELAAQTARQPGFDIVLANPPYVRYQTLRPIRAGLQADYKEVYDGSADLLIYFFARAFQLASDGGMIVFVTSNQW